MHLNKSKVDDEDRIPVPVQVQCMQLGWISRIPDQGQFLGLVKILNSTSNKSVLETNFVNCLLVANWELYKKKIFETQFVPFMVYLFSIINFMCFALDDKNLIYDGVDNDLRFYNGVYYPALGFCYMFVINQIMCEYTQIMNAESVKKHFSVYWNVNDLLYLILNLIVLTTNANSLMPINIQRMFSAVAAVCLWMKVLDWLRLFDSTAFFIALYQETIKGVTSFLIIMSVWYMTFGTAFYIINLNRVQGGPADLVPSITPLWFINVFEN